MGYRYNIPVDENGEPPKPEDHLMRFDVRNGAVMKLTLDCRYCTKDIDHPFWIWPRYPGDSAVARKSDGYPWYKFRDIRWPYENTPIILNSDEEFGDSAYVGIMFEDNAPLDAEYIHWRGWVDPDTPNLIKILVKTDFPVFEDKPIENNFTIFIARRDDEYMVDAVLHGTLVILPGRPLIITDTAEQEEE